MLRRRTIFLCVLSLSLVGIRPAASNPYFIQNVGPITNSGYISDLGLNDSGEMVGTNNEMAWSWTASGGLVQLNPLLAAAAPTASWAWKINDAGQICGTYLDSTGENQDAYIYQRQPRRNQLGHLYRSAKLHRRTGHGLSHQLRGAGGSGLYGNRWVDAVRRRPKSSAATGRCCRAWRASAVIPTASITPGTRAASVHHNVGTAPMAARLRTWPRWSAAASMPQDMSGNGQIVGNGYGTPPAPLRTPCSGRAAQRRPPTWAASAALARDGLRRR